MLINLHSTEFDIAVEICTAEFAVTATELKKGTSINGRIARKCVLAILRDNTDLSWQETAWLFQIPIGTVRSRPGQSAFSDRPDIAHRINRCEYLFAQRTGKPHASTETALPAIVSPSAIPDILPTLDNAPTDHTRQNEGSKEWARLSYPADDRIEVDMLRNYTWEERVEKARTALLSGQPQKAVREQCSWYVFKAAVEGLEARV